MIKRNRQLYRQGRGEKREKEVKKENIEDKRRQKEEMEMGIGRKISNR